MSEKQKIINDVYFDRAGYGSKQRTLSEAREKDKSITMADINEFFRKNVEQKRKPVGQNSFIAPHSAYEYQMDLFLINDLDEQKFRVGVLMTDVFDKFMYVVPIKSKQEGDVASGMIECLNKMGKKPQIIYTDDEGALNKEHKHCPNTCEWQRRSGSFELIKFTLECLAAGYFSSNFGLPAGYFSSNFGLPAGYFSSNFGLPAGYFSSNFGLPACYF